MIKAGQRLHDERIRKKLSIEDVSSSTKIRASFITAIEKGEYNKLPSSSYAQGFVRNYTRFLGLPEEEVMALFRREFDVKKQIKVLPEGLAKEEDFPLERFKIKQTIIISASFLLILLLYILFQYRYAIINPPLTVSYPQENMSIKSDSIIVSGSTNEDSIVFVNEEQAALDEDGNFRKEITVFAGENKIRVRAVNRFNRQTLIEREINIEE